MQELVIGNEFVARRVVVVIPERLDVIANVTVKVRISQASGDGFYSLYCHQSDASQHA
jgi:hypothetical protein